MTFLATGPGNAQVTGAALGQLGVRDNEMHIAFFIHHKFMNRRLHPVTLQQAADDSPTLARLAALSQDSCARLKACDALIPANLRSAITAGPIDGPVWCLLVDSSAAAAKLRQLSPALLAHLHGLGWETTSIRIKVRMVQQ